MILLIVRRQMPLKHYTCWVTQPRRGKFNWRCNRTVSRRSRSLIWVILLLEALLIADDDLFGVSLIIDRLEVRKVDDCWKDLFVYVVLDASAKMTNEQIKYVNLSESRIQTITHLSLEQRWILIILIVQETLDFALNVQRSRS